MRNSVPCSCCNKGSPDITVMRPLNLSLQKKSIFIHQYIPRSELLTNLRRCQIWWRPLLFGSCVEFPKLKEAWLTSWIWLGLHIWMEHLSGIRHCIKNEGAWAGPQCSRTEGVKRMFFFCTAKHHPCWGLALRQGARLLRPWAGKEWGAGLRSRINVLSGESEPL